ncbi:hypothetical protein [Saprospira grandis]|uniref:Uncharacterized protein n=1 Tax=Saprospira grandis (strain Lewin) TaxID=984262 RepID=H6L4H6_SAPGL|nr:hypothetical protein [Saprospira grandis]AFC22855.1 hypothetical protein SGRA_0110 [Saprospira grandis str. Lewin]
MEVGRRSKGSLSTIYVVLPLFLFLLLFGGRDEPKEVTVFFGPAFEKTKCSISLKANDSNIKTEIVLYNSKSVFPGKDAVIEAQDSISSKSREVFALLSNMVKVSDCGSENILDGTDVIIKIGDGDFISCNSGNIESNVMLVELLNDLFKFSIENSNNKIIVNYLKRRKGEF